MTDPLDIERALADIAAVTPDDPTPAIAKVRTALAKPQQSIRWLWPLSIAAAAALVVITLVIVSSSRPASAADNLATTLVANQGYKGWVHMTGSGIQEGEKITRHWNTQTGMSALIDEINGETTINVRDPKARTFQEYRSSTGRIRICELPAEEAGKLLQEAAQTPLMFSDIIEGMRSVLGEKSVTITQSIDNGMDRFDIHVDESAENRLWNDQLPPRKRWFGTESVPRHIWADRETKLIRDVTINEDDLLFTYGAPEMTSLYDLGVPRDAKIYDTRTYHPTKETLDVLNRLKANVLPDGIAAILTEKDNKSLSFRLSTHTETKSYGRIYDKVVLGESGEQGVLAIPADWTGVGADEFLRRAIATIPHQEMTLIDAVGVSGFKVRIFDDTGKLRGTTGPTRPLSPIFDGLSMGSPTYGVPMLPALSSGGASGDQVELFTDKDHPGQLALHFTWHYDNPDNPASESWLWLDPRQNDRPISIVTNANKISNAPPFQTLITHTEAQFSDFTTLPGAPPRTYPATVIATTYTPGPDGKLTIQSHEKATFHYFPGRSLPEVQLPPR